MELEKLDKQDKQLAKIFAKSLLQEKKNNMENTPSRDGGYNKRKSKFEIEEENKSKQSKGPKGEKRVKFNQVPSQTAGGTTSGKDTNWDNKQCEKFKICLGCGNDNAKCAPVNIHHSGNCPKGCPFCKEKGCNPYKCKERYAGFGDPKAGRTEPRYLPHNARKWQIDSFYENKPEHEFDENGYPIRLLKEDRIE